MRSGWNNCYYFPESPISISNKNWDSTPFCCNSSADSVTERISGNRWISGSVWTRD